MEKDLGWNELAGEMLAHSTVLTEMKDLRDNLEEWMQSESVPTPIVVGLASSRIRPEPLGVSLVISAWNYPVYTSLPLVAASIAAGNCVVLKPSEGASHSSGALKRLFDNYLNPEFYQCV